MDKMLAENPTQEIRRAIAAGQRVLDKMLAANPAPTLANAANILRATRQEGQYATKYSNVFDLKSGDIFLFRFPDQPEAVKPNLAEELKKGRHSYDIPELGDPSVRKSR